MKKYYNCITLLFGAIILFTACQEEKPDFFDESANSVYFNYEYSSELTKDINFANYIIGNPKSVTINISLKILGYLTDETRKVVLKTKAIDEYEMPSIEIPEITFGAKEYEKNVAIVINRPTVANKKYAVCIYIDDYESGAINGGVDGRSEYYIYVREEHEKPADWTSNSIFQGYLGEWSPEKHKYLVEYFNNNEYIDSIKNETDAWSILAQCNKEAVDTVRNSRNENPDSGIILDFPFHTDCSYEKPPYWGESHDRHLGEYTDAVFAHITKMLNVNTANEWDILGNESNLGELNKTAVKVMMETYNRLFIEWGLPWNDYYKEAYVPMLPNIDYELIQPIFWSAEGPDQGDRVKTFYGEYSYEKYKFMIETFMKRQEEAGKPFILLEMFPIKYNNSTKTIAFDNDAGGIRAFNEYKTFFKNAYNSAPAGTYGFTFP